MVTADALAIVVDAILGKHLPETGHPIVRRTNASRFRRASTPRRTFPRQPVRAAAASILAIVALEGIVHWARFRGSDALPAEETQESLSR
jgi:cobalamin biosynthesis protein CobD/CbiB